MMYTYGYVYVVLSSGRLPPPLVWSHEAMPDAFMFLLSAHSSVICTKICLYSRPFWDSLQKNTIGFYTIGKKLRLHNHPTHSHRGKAGNRWRAQGCTIYTWQSFHVTLSCRNGFSKERTPTSRTP